MLDKIRKTVEQICERLNAVKGRGEEATKQALVYPLLEALGYNIWLPTEVCPEYEADFAIKKNGQKEKVDIAIGNKIMVSENVGNMLLYQLQMNIVKF